jgi:protein-L-isoaspartate(D-aspartate) O-methyltransferase
MVAGATGDGQIASQAMSSREDEQYYAAARDRMVTEQLAERGILSAAVLDAMRRVPRERFMPPGTRGRAYTDGAQPIDCNQTISQPYMVARMTELLELQPEQQVLEVGTGSGYQTAILAHLARQVFTIEWHLKLMNQAAERLEALTLENVAYRCGDGSLGWPERAPFDAIIVTAGAPDVPDPLKAQLADGGRLVVPVGPAGDQTLVVVRRAGDRFDERQMLKCRFVKLFGAAGWRD